MNGSQIAEYLDEYQLAQYVEQRIEQDGGLRSAAAEHARANRDRLLYDMVTTLLQARVVPPHTVPGAVKEPTPGQCKRITLMLKRKYAVQ